MSTTDRTSRPPTFADQVLAATGLSGVFAANALRRCCARAGVDFDAINRHSLARVLPSLEPLLAIYLPRDQIKARMDLLRALADGRA